MQAIVRFQFENEQFLWFFHFVIFCGKCNLNKFFFSKISIIFQIFWGFSEKMIVEKLRVFWIHEKVAGMENREGKVRVRRVKVALHEKRHVIGRGAEIRAERHRVDHLDPRLFCFFGFGFVAI